MYIQNATYKAVPTAGLTFPLTEGTVLTVGDVTGIVPENISLAAPTGLIYLATGGTIDLTSEANAGVSFTDAELNALGGDFNFIPVTEAGGGGGALIVNVSIDPNTKQGTCDKTAGEIYSADNSVFVLGGPYNARCPVLMSAFPETSAYIFAIFFMGEYMQFRAQTASDYPVSNG